MSSFLLKAPYKPTGDQPAAITKLVELIKKENQHQTLLGVTGSGKTFTMAHVIEAIQRPTLIISHNKTLAAQLYQEFKTFFPENAVHYFVSYYDYYQPEAYIPQSDTYIEKDAKINDFIDAMRHATTASALTRKDLVIIASVSCIYGLGDPIEYEKAALHIKEGAKLPQKKFLRSLVELQYERNDYDLLPGTFRARGDSVEITQPSGNKRMLIEWDGNTIERVSGNTVLFPAKHFVTPQDKLELAISNIKLEMETQVSKFKKIGKLLEAQRLKQRTEFDLKMLKEVGYTHGIENYSRQLSFRNPGDPPHTLIDYLPKNCLIFIDESHVTLPQIRGMYKGDRARKQTLIDYGFRLPSAIDNRPLTFEEFNKRIKQIVYVSATPSDYELDISGKNNIAEQLIRPTGLLDPKIFVYPTNNQIESCVLEIKKRISLNERVLVTTLTKRTAEDMAEYLREQGIKTEYIHADVKTMERQKIITDLRKGTYDTIVGINLLREGLDLPEVSLVIILDADKEGFLRNTTTLIQTIGRAARHRNATVIMYADTVTKSMKQAIEETQRRRKAQEKYNKKHGITPQKIVRNIDESIFGYSKKSKKIDITKMSKQLSREKLKEELTEEMRAVAKKLDFEQAAELRDLIKSIK